MKVINLGLDKKILDRTSAVAQRAMAYGDRLDKYSIVVYGQAANLELSPKTKVRGIVGPNKFISLLHIFQYLDQHLKDDKYDLMTIQDVYYIASIGLNLADKYGLKTEIQVHGFEKLSFFRRIIAKNNLKKADRIRTVSSRLKKQIIKEFGVKEEKIYVAPVAINKKKIIDSQIIFNLKEKYPKDFIFLTVGRLVAVKNIGLQIKALSRLANKNFRLIIVGDGPQKQKLIDLTKKLNIENRVNFFGWVDNLGGYYKTADCLLLSSDSEGYGMVIAEAVLVSLPVIMTDVGVAGELIKNNVNGFIVPIKDENSLASAMGKVLEDRELLQKFSTGSLLFQDKIFDKETLIDKIINNWEKLVHVQE